MTPAEYGPRPPCAPRQPRSPAEVEVGDTVRLKTDGLRTWCVLEVVTRRSQELSPADDPHDALCFRVANTSEYSRIEHEVRACELDLTPQSDPPEPAGPDEVLDAGFVATPGPAAVECADGRGDPDF